MHKCLFQVVWVKLGHYRWWPAKVLHPAEIPDNVARKAHGDGEFPIQFCGTNEYYWMNHGRCFLYEEGDAERIPGAGVGSAKGIEGAFLKGVREAAELFESYKTEKEQREAANESKVKCQWGVKPPLYTKIKTNRPYGDCPVYTQNAADVQACECKADDKVPCGPDSECINRILLTECQQNCPAKDRCMNKMFQKRQYPGLKVKRTNGRGWGLYVKEDIKRGAFVIEYVGELITMDEFKMRIDVGMKKKNEEVNFYYMTMDNHRMLDAGPKGNIARFMNHSCDPNCETQKWTVNGDTRVGLFAKKDIPGGTELTFNYQFEAVGEVKKTCLCGAKNCSGLIGEKPKEQSNNGSSASKNDSQLSKKKKKKLKPPKVNKIWEDFCFRCYEDGELLMCDFKTCPKVYHLACLNRDKIPREKFWCPWHHCVTCGKLAVSHCIHCPNAYCRGHNTVLTDHPELGRICNEHEDEMEDTLEFYRKAGGVKHLVPNPNVPLEEVLPMTKKPQASKEKGDDDVNEEEDTEKSNHAEEHKENRPSPTKRTYQSIGIPKPPNPLLAKPHKPSVTITPLRQSLGMQRKSSPLFGTSTPKNSITGLVKKDYCKCIEIDCSWTGLKSKFLEHLNSHNVSANLEIVAASSSNPVSQQNVYTCKRQCLY